MVLDLPIIKFAREKLLQRNKQKQNIFNPQKEEIQPQRIFPVEETFPEEKTVPVKKIADQYTELVLEIGKLLEKQDQVIIVIDGLDGSGAKDLGLRIAKEGIPGVLFRGLSPDDIQFFPSDEESNLHIFREGGNTKLVILVGSKWVYDNMSNNEKHTVIDLSIKVTASEDVRKIRLRKEMKLSAEKVKELIDLFDADDDNNTHFDIVIEESSGNEISSLSKKSIDESINKIMMDRILEEANNLVNPKKGLVLSNSFVEQAI